MIEWAKFAAVLFDLDGVLTDTASLHARAWKETFDGFLADRFPDQAPFTIEVDYRVHVDGRPRYEGVATFLASREIMLPWGDAEDSAEAETVCGIGNRKNQRVGSLISSGGVAVYLGSKKPLDHPRQDGGGHFVGKRRTGARNCRTLPILRRGGRRQHRLSPRVERKAPSRPTPESRRAVGS